MLYPGGIDLGEQVIYILARGYISFESVESICRVLNCGVDDILEFIPEDNGGKENG